MTRLSKYFSDEHRYCDLLWSRVEAAADDGDPTRAEGALVVFCEAMERHFAREEQVLFPAFERATGLTDDGPTPVMRAEHAQIRALMAQLEAAAAAGDLDRLVVLGDLLLTLVQEHNAREERLLYGPADAALSEQWTDLQERARTVL